MILLLHLTKCPALHHEETLQSKELLTKTFAIVGNRLQRGRVVSLYMDTAKTQDKPENGILIYCLLAKLRYRVWIRAAWGIPSQAGQGCPLDNLREAIDYLYAGEPVLSQDYSLDTHGDGEKESALGVMPTIELGEEEDFHQYDDLFEQFLQPRILT